jgi:hypothetical protein
MIALLRPTLLLWLSGHLKHGASGRLLRSAGGHLIHACSSSGPAPCSCPGGLANTYTVSGFGGLHACGSCDPSTDPPWSGALYRVDSTSCIWWAADASFDPLSIDSHRLNITYTQIVLNTVACRWELYISCSSLTAPPADMWVGYKTTGSTPAGTYVFDHSDCGNSAGTMTVS